MLSPVVRFLVAVAAFALSAQAIAADPIRLSSDLDVLRKTLAQKPASGACTLVIDRPTLDPEATASLLTALDDLRRSGGKSIALCPTSAAGIKAGSAVVAMACDAIAFVKGAEITGAETAWCTSESRREELAQKLEKLGRIDARLAKRFVENQDALFWSAKGQFDTQSGGVKLADAGKAIALGATQLKRIGVDAREFASLDEAIAAADAGSIPTRASRVASPAGPSGSGAPSNGTANGTSNGASNGAPAGRPTTAPRGTPAGAPAAPNGAPAGTTAPATASPGVDEAKLNPKLAEYAETLTALQGILREFNSYYIGDKGIWTSRPQRGLKWVWQDGSDHTRHPDTKVACERLQRDIKTKMTNLASIAKVVERIVKDRDHPQVVRMKQHQVALDGLRIGIERNKVSSYDTYFGQVMALR